jgi:hypothetical protein
MDGEVVHRWSTIGQPVKMLPGGSLLGYKRNRLSKNNPLLADPMPSQESSSSKKPKRRAPWQDAVEFVQEGWDGREEWSFANWDDDNTGIMMSRQHHDFQREGNPVGYYAPGQEFTENGRTLILGHKNKVMPAISDKELMDDVIYEIDWQGNLTGFEWHAADHFSELGFDETARNDILKGILYAEHIGSYDWLHINTMSLLGINHWYDETLDERFNPENIIIDCRWANFVAIISRATGNIAWRIGPDFSEGTPEHGIGQFIGPHHAHMIPRGLPGEGNILIFDNGGKTGYGGPDGFPRYSRDYSRVVEFNPVTLEIVWQYGTQDGDDNFYSVNISSAQRLPNGNTLITDGPNGRIFEVTTDKVIAWQYISPLTERGGNAVYRAYRVPPEWVPGNPAGYTEWSKLYE